MPRLQITLPESYSFSTVIPIRITDINYGGHVGNDSILSLLHEARMQFLNHLGYTELDIEGFGLIMRDVSIDFKKELFYGSSIKVSISTEDFSKATFDLVYKVEVEAERKLMIVATAKTGMVYFDYKNKKIAAIPDHIRLKLMNRNPGIQGNQD